jgi:hypothetical protein
MQETHEPSITVGRVTAHRTRRRRRRLAFWLTLGLAGLPLLLAAALFARLQMGPIEAPFIREQILAELTRLAGDAFKIDVAEARVVQRDQGLSVEVYNLSVRDQGGAPVLSAPRTEIAFDPRSLARGQITPERVTLVGTRLHLLIDASGRLAIEPEGAGEARIADPLLALATLAGRGAAIGDASRVNLSDGILDVTDQRSGRTLRYGRLAVRFIPATAEAPFRATLDAEREGRRVAIRAGAAPENDGTFRLTGSFLGFGAEELALAAGLKELPLSVQTPLTLAGEAVLAPEGHLAGASATVTAGPGNVLVPLWPEETLVHDRAEARLRWLAAEKRLMVEAAHWHAGQTQFTLTGDLAPVEGQDGVWSYRIAGEDGILQGVGPDDPPVRIGKATGHGSIDINSATLRLDHAAVSGPGVDASISLTTRAEAEGLGLWLQVRGQAMPLRTALRLWPRLAATEVHDYLAKHARGGQLVSTDVRIDMPAAVMNEAVQKRPVPAEAVQAQFEVEDGVLAAIEGLPPVSGLGLKGSATGRALQISASRAHLDVQPGRRLALSEGSFAIADLARQPSQARLILRARAPAETAFAFLALPPVAGAAPGLPAAADVKGQADARATITFPLKDRLQPTEIDVQVAGTLSGFTLDKAFGKERLEAATLQVTSDRSGLDIKGQGRLLGLPVAIDLSRGIGNARRGSKDNAAVLQFTVDDAARSRLGLNLGRKLTGPVEVKVTADLASPELLEGSIDVDLARAAMDGLVLGLVKPAGRPAKLTADIEQTAQGFTLTDLSFEGGGVTIKGAAQLAGDGQPVSARLSLLRLSPGDNAKAEYDRAGGGRLVVRGNNFDARPFLKGTKPGESNDGSVGDVDLDLKTTLLSGYNREVITNAEVRLVRKGGITRQQSISGRLGGQALAIGYTPGTGASGTTTVETDDAGALLRFLDIYSRMEGGRLDATLKGTPEVQDGTLMIRDFALRDEPALKRLLSTPQPATGEGEGAALSLAPLAAGEAAKFTKMRVDFSRNGPRYAISDAVIWGPQIGLTLSGQIDTRADRLAINGTFIPAYTLNNVFARIPVLGNLLGANQYEGLLGITFRLTGRAAAPTVTVSPISALAPGIFRRIFEFRQGSGAAAPDITSGSR